MQTDPIYYYKIANFLFQQKFIDKSLIYFTIYLKKTKNPNYQWNMTNKVFDTISSNLLNQLRDEMNR